MDLYEAVEKAGNAIRRASDAVWRMEEVAENKVGELVHKADEFFQKGGTGGITLAVFALLAILIANSPLYGIYNHFLHDMHFRIGFNDTGSSYDFELGKPLLLWINDGLMAIFFFLVGVEIKEELTEGRLSRKSQALLPFLAAIGGMVVPVLIFYFMNADNPEYMKGWAIPAATDIAFALGILGLLKSALPAYLKVLLASIAVIDDLGAILIIAFFYTENISIQPLIVISIALFALMILNRRNVCNVTPYVLIGIILWLAVLKSGVHATLAGVITALFIPVRCKKDESRQPCNDIQHALHPWVAYGILPVFAFANSGVALDGITLASFYEPLTLGIILGLVVGKQLGVFAMLWIAIKSGLSSMPENVTWLQLYGVSALCGVGFTMSLFIGGLAFDDPDMQMPIRIGVISASIISGLLGYLALRYSIKSKNI